jgi:hypothetical protein
MRAITQTRSDEYLRAGLTPSAVEKCYDFVNHGGQTSGDKTKYSLKTGEHYEELAGWAVGGDNVIFPADMRLELPASGILNGQWHYYNQGSEGELDSSAIQVCVVPATARKFVAGITWLGTETSTARSACQPIR